MTLEQLNTLLQAGTSVDITETIATLKASRTPPDLTAVRKQFDIGGHDSLDKLQRQDKIIKGADETESRIEKVNRIAAPMQELITERAVSFLFGNPVKLVCQPKTDREKIVLDALKRIYKDNKIDSFNAEIGLEMFRSTEVAECWFPVTKSEAHDNYGFTTAFKLRVMAFNPWDGNELYPTFDETGDLIAFSRAFNVVDEQAQTTHYFETYTASEKIVWKEQTGSAASGWVEVSRNINVIGKIPVVYGKQKTVEWANVQVLIDRLERLLSNYADTIDYHSSPTIFVTGKIQSMPKKGESGKVIQGDKDAKAEYLSWQQAPEMVKLEIETLFRLIYSMSQTPDISFESVKNLGDISGVALKMLFLDAHLKVKKKQRVFDAYLERRANIVKAYIGYMDTSLKKEVSAIDIDSQIQPFIVDDLTTLITNLTTANAGAPIISQKTGIKLSGLVDDVDAEYEQIQEEEQRAKTFEVTQPTF